MPEVYVLLNTEIGAEADVLKAVKQVEGVKEAFNLWGIYDIILRIKVDSTEKLMQLINEKLQINRVHSRLTVVVTET